MICTLWWKIPLYLCMHLFAKSFLTKLMRTFSFALSDTVDISCNYCRYLHRHKHFILSLKKLVYQFTVFLHVVLLETCFALLCDYQNLYFLNNQSLSSVKIIMRSSLPTSYHHHPISFSLFIFLLTMRI